MPAYRDKRDGRWRYRKWVSLPSGRRKRIAGTPATDTKKASEHAESLHVLRVTNPGLAPALAEKEDISFQAFVEERWLKTYPSSAGNRTLTVEEKERHVRIHLLPILRDEPLALPPETIDGLFSRLHKELAPKSVKNVRATLHTILRSAKRWGVISEVPELPKVKVPENEWDWLTSQESSALLGAARDLEERALLTFALHTGARFGEQRALSWGDVDWTNRQIVIRRNQPHNTDTVGPTKSGRTRRVPMTDTLHAALQEMEQGDGRVFGRRRDRGALSLYAVRERLHRACGAAGLREVRWHDLRHSFASQLVSAGVPLRQVQEWLGHSTIMMTMRYAHLAPNGAAIKALDSGQPVGNVPQEPT